LEAVENSDNELQFVGFQLANSFVAPDFRLSNQQQLLRRVRQIARNPHERNIGRGNRLK
jgi:hypothetical protein